jgi:hypothetical protein
MSTPIVCPNCGQEDSIECKHDAWACFLVTGVDKEGNLTKGRDFDTQVFDASEIGCTSCGKIFEEGQLVRQLQNLQSHG